MIFTCMLPKEKNSSEAVVNILEPNWSPWWQYWVSHKYNAIEGIPREFQHSYKKMLNDQIFPFYRTLRAHDIFPSEDDVYFGTVLGCLLDLWN